MNIYLDSKRIEWKMAFAHDTQLKDLGEFKNIDAIINSGLDVLECTVPGNFELDLLKNGIIEDPFYGSNVLDLHKFKDCHVWYFTRFRGDFLDQTRNIQNTAQDVYLIFEGLDTYADIYLNGSLITSTDNMPIPHRIPINGLIQADNEVLIHIRPAYCRSKKI